VILIRVLTFIGFVVPDDASCRGTRSAVTGHVTRNAANYRTFNASLSICRGARSEGNSHHEQCNEHFHFKSPMSQPSHKKACRHLVPSDRQRKTEQTKELEIVYQSQQ
jgi:hypothetical protein